MYNVRILDKFRTGAEYFDSEQKLFSYCNIEEKELTICVRDRLCVRVLVCIYVFVSAYINNIFIHKYISAENRVMCCISSIFN